MYSSLERIIRNLFFQSPYPSFLIFFLHITLNFFIFFRIYRAFWHVQNSSAQKLFDMLKKLRVRAKKVSQQVQSLISYENFLQKKFNTFSECKLWGSFSVTGKSKVGSKWMKNIVNLHIFLTILLYTWVLCTNY